MLYPYESMNHVSPYLRPHPAADYVTEHETIITCDFAAPAEVPEDEILKDLKMSPLRAVEAPAPLCSHQVQEADQVDVIADVAP